MKAETRPDRRISDAHIALGAAARLVLQRYNQFCHLALGGKALGGSLMRLSECG